MALLLFRIGDTQDHHEIANGAIGDEHLATIDDILIAVLLGSSSDPGNICTSIGFGEGPSGNGLAFCKRG